MVRVHDLCAMAPKPKATRPRPKTLAKALPKLPARRMVGKVSPSTASVVVQPPKAAPVRSQKDRRDVADKAARAIEKRLKLIPSEIWSSKVNQDGEKIVTVVESKYLELAGTGKKIPARFWDSLMQDFGLWQYTAADLLDEPDVVAGELPDAQLMDALAELHSDNPVAVSAAPLERFLAHCQGLTYLSTYGLLQAIMPNAELSHVNVVKGQVAVLQFWARTMCSLGLSSKPSH